MAMDFTVKPEIFVFHDAAFPADTLQGILLGIEEERIPFRVVAANDFPSAAAAAYQGAQESSLNVAIGCIGNVAALHYKNLKPEQPYQQIQYAGTSPEQVLRNFGANAARLVKGIPFKSIDPEEAFAGR